MPNRRVHNKYCEDRGLNKNVCDHTNREMDKYSQNSPGCNHRKKGHNFNDGVKIASNYALNNFIKCELKTGDKCINSLFKDFHDSMLASRIHIRVDKQDSENRGTCDTSNLSI